MEHTLGQTVGVRVVEFILDAFPVEEELSDQTEESLGQRSVVIVHTNHVHIGHLVDGQVLEKGLEDRQAVCGVLSSCSIKEVP